MSAKSSRTRSGRGGPAAGERGRKTARSKETASRRTAGRAGRKAAPAGGKKAKKASKSTPRASRTAKKTSATAAKRTTAPAARKKAAPTARKKAEKAGKKGARAPARAAARREGAAGKRAAAAKGAQARGAAAKAARGAAAQPPARQRREAAARRRAEAAAAADSALPALPPPQPAEGVTEIAAATPGSQPALAIVPSSVPPPKKRTRFSRRSSPMGKKRQEMVFEGPPPVLTPELPELPVRRGRGAERPSVLEANTEFYAALQERDIGRMSRAWAHDATVRCAQPNGVLLRGWEEVRNGFEQIFSVDRPCRVELTQIYAEQSEDLAHVSLVERVSMPQVSRPRTEHPATNVFRWQDGRWLVILHHAT
ncbi:MAG: hypothetical protein KatS3mg102_1556 [Planctomycetota bacterium]|nr:MAG: hypothetical protein KatS3mg102_1556 [Planctomycetota bacterium]